eukprot:GSChrysophyteH2.ASY1.ANO1.868.1 assembled CDS
MPPYTSDIVTKPKRRARSSSRKGTRTSPRAAAARKDDADPSSSSSSSSSKTTDDADAWIYRLDVGAFKKDMDALKAELTKAQGPADVAQYSTVRLATEVFAVAGTLAMLLPWQWMLAPLLLGIASTARWTMVGHHTLHGGYDFMEQKSCNRFVFAAGPWRRLVDWFDWMLPEAWNVEHNHLHHYALNEPADPDLVEDNLRMMRNLPLPQAVKRPIVMLMAGIWKWWYYAPNTFKHLLKKRYPKTEQGAGVWVLTSLWWENPVAFAHVVTEALLPYALFKFGVYPLPFLALGWAAYWNALACVLAADVVANVYSFVIIVTNHCGPDLYRFETPVTPYSGEFYVRAIVGSANFRTGTEAIDFSQGYLNYQIEHHCFPSLSMLSYRKAQPLVAALCAKHGVPYVQEHVFTRLGHLVDVMVGASDMRKWPADAPF